MSRIELHSGRGNLAVVYDGRPPERGDVSVPLPDWKSPTDADHRGTASTQVPDPGWYRMLATRRGGGDLVVYDGSLAFHARFGGSTYYRSRSGASHSGSIPAAAGVAQVSTYRVDTFRPWLGQLRANKVYGRRLLVPIDYQRGTVPADWPVIDCTGITYRGDTGYGDGARLGPREPWTAGTLRQDVSPVHQQTLTDPGRGRETVGRLRFLAADGGEVNRLLLGEELTCEPHELAWTVYQPDSQGVPERREYAVIAHTTAWAWGDYGRRLAVRRVVEELLWPVLAFAGEDAGTPTHWLGIRRTGEYAYRIRGGRAMSYVHHSELTDAGGDPEAAAETLTNMLPDGYLALTPELVVGRGHLLGPGREIMLQPGEELRLIQTRDTTLAAELLATGSPEHARREPAETVA